MTGPGAVEGNLERRHEAKVDALEADRELLRTEFAIQKAKYLPDNEVLVAAAINLGTATLHVDDTDFVVETYRQAVTTRLIDYPLQGL